MSIPKLGKPHMPTLYSVLIGVVIIAALFHFAGRRRH